MKLNIVLYVNNLMRLINIKKVNKYIVIIDQIIIEDMEEMKKLTSLCQKMQQQKE